MSLYKGHIAGGVFAFLIYLVFLVVLFPFKPSFEIIVWFVLCILGALWPDVDTSSFGQKLFYGGFLVFDTVLLLMGRYKEAALLGFFALLPIVGKHRGWNHSISAAFLVPSPLLFLPLVKPDLGVGGLEYYTPVVIGYMSHLVLDRELKLY